MNSKNFDEFDLSKVIKEIPPQFNKVITELVKTIDMIGEVVTDNLSDSINTKTNDVAETSSDDTLETSSNNSTETSSNINADSLPDEDLNKSNPDNVPSDLDFVKETKSILNLTDMVTLLEINEALKKLGDTLKIIVGKNATDSNGLMLELNKIRSLIVNVSAVQPTIHPQNGIVVDNNEWIFKLLDDETIDNEQKASILLGLK